ncbi:hypothetical protein RR42_s1398 [Cupriavidus basilensis]|uniref:Uncharacterized protein n=1 Tax=Cupriavidus basilensis TaxID=68895 RepID=A0A0C4YQX9_9BURK|nr:hypothetical protein RR42_s1398 [Cupriavidus basilensis]
MSGFHNIDSLGLNQNVIDVIMHGFRIASIDKEIDYFL